MKITRSAQTITVERGDDSPVRGGSWGSVESAFWHRLQVCLNALQVATTAKRAAYRPSRDRWIKTVPAKDGHLTGAPYYLTNRERSRCVFDEAYALRSAAESYNEGKRVELRYLEA